MLPISNPCLVSGLHDYPLPEAKRPRKEFALPDNFLVLVGTVPGTYNLIGVVTFSAVRVYVPGEATTLQFLKLVEHGGPPDESRYVTWTVDVVRPFAATFALESTDLKHSGSSVGHMLTTSAHSRVRSTSMVQLGSEMVSLGQLYPKQLPRVFLVQPYAVQVLFEEHKTELVTPRGHCYHAGLIRALQEHRSSASHQAPPRQDIDTDPEPDGEDPEPDPADNFDQSSYSFERMVAALRLSSLLKNADNLIDAVKLAAELVLEPEESSAVCSRIDSGALKLPRADALHRAARKLDCLESLWVRTQPDTHKSRYLMCDASEKGFNYPLRARDFGGM